MICTPGYAKSVRNVTTAEKNAVYAEYGITSHPTGTYEVDHLISLELGGSNDIANLWPEAAEPRPGFHEKDRVENELHDQVCAGKMTLAEAQQAIAANWLVLWTSGVAASADALGDSSADLEVASTPASTVAGSATTVAAPPTSVNQAVATSTPAASKATTLGGVTFLSVVGGRPGQTASITVQTLPGASSSIAYVTPAGTASVAQGLVPVNADANGRATWTWLIGTRTRPGTGMVTVTCGGASASTGIAIG
jgi:hypothetical protein